MTFQVDMGQTDGGRAAAIDLEELLATRLLVQGNSGSGKSHLLRRLLEGSARQVQQVVIDPEGDFVTLSGPYGHVAIEAYGVWGPKVTFGHHLIGLIRSTFLIDKDGRLAADWRVTRIKGHAEKVLETAQKLFG